MGAKCKHKPTEVIESPDVQIRIQVFGLGRRYKALWQKHRRTCLAAHVLLVVLGGAWLLAHRKEGPLSRGALPHMDRVKERLAASGFWTLSSNERAILRGRPLYVTKFGPDATKPDRCLSIYQDEMGVVRGVLTTVYGDRGMENYGIPTDPLEQLKQLTLLSPDQLGLLSFQRAQKDVIRDLTGINIDAELHGLRCSIDSNRQALAAFIVGDNRAIAYSAFIERSGLSVEFLCYGVPREGGDDKVGSADLYSATVIIRDGTW